jgi:hypothetical protein
MYCALLRAPVRSYDLTARALPQRIRFKPHRAEAYNNLALAGRDDGWAGRRMADRLDAMSVGIQHKRAVVIGVIVQPESRRTIVATPTRKRRPVKGIDRRAVGSAKADVCTGNRRPQSSRPRSVGSSRSVRIGKGRRSMQPRSLELL